MATSTVNLAKTANRTKNVEETPGAARYAWAITRLALASVFLWAFFDKLFGLGYATPPERAWLNGGSPTTGFLANSQGWFADTFQAMAGLAVVDWLFMLGLLGIGLALLLGIGMRIAAISGATMMALMYLAAMPGATNPFIDDHVVYALVLVGLALANAGRVLGFGRQWSELAIVRNHPILE